MQSHTNSRPYNVCEQITENSKLLVEVNFFSGEPLKLIGKGEWGEVFLGYQQNDFPVALKILNEQKLENRLLHAKFVKISSFNIPYIVQYLGSDISTLVLPEKFVFEFMPGGTLKDFILKENVTWRLRLRWALQLAEAISGLHINNFIHRDLKLENVLLDDKLNVKLADLDFAHDLENGKPTRFSGTLLAFSPEVLLHKKMCELDSLKAHIKMFLNTVDQRNSSHVQKMQKYYSALQKQNKLIIKCEKNYTASMQSKASDVYAFALLLWSLVAKREWAYDWCTDITDLLDFLDNGDREKIPEYCPADIKAIIETAWASDPNKRPLMSDIFTSLKSVTQQALDVADNDEIKYLEKIKTTIT